MSQLEIANDIKTLLAKWQPHIWHVANSGSVYIKFPHWALGSIRIGDHNSRVKYNYRYEVRLDLTSNDPEITTHSKGYVLKPSAIDLLCEVFEKEAKERNVKPGDKQTWEQYKGICTARWKERKYKKVGIK